MRRPGLNLARRPFANNRPVVRVTLLAWLLGALLLAGNLWLYWDFLAGRGTASARLVEIDKDLIAADNRIGQLTAELADYHLEEQNAEIAYLNARIDERLFSWSKLFDRVARLLPADVRLLKLAPARKDRLRERTAASSGKFVLQMEGQARNDHAVLEFVDRLYEDPAFELPNLASESEDLDGFLSFQLTVPYDPTTTDTTFPVMMVAPPSRPASSSLELEK